MNLLIFEFVFERFHRSVQLLINHYSIRMAHRNLQLKLTQLLMNTAVVQSKHSMLKLEKLITDKNQGIHHSYEYFQHLNLDWYMEHAYSAKPVW